MNQRFFRCRNHRQNGSGAFISRFFLILCMVVRSFKFRLYPSKEQEILLRLHLFISKNVWNECLAYVKRFYNDFQRFPSLKCLRGFAVGQGLYSQTGQDVVARLYDALKQRKIKGFPRFKSFNRVKSLCYPQYGFKLADKELSVTPFGSLRIKKHRNINGKIKTLSLKRGSNKWFAIFTAEQEKSVFKSNGNGLVGLDLGIKTFAALSNGLMIDNPHFLEKRAAKLGLFQRRLSRKVLRGKNRAKARFKVAVQHEKVANSRKDFHHKQSTRLVNDFSLIALENLNVKKMVQSNLGKSISDVGWSSFTNMLAYKAESAGCKVVFVNPYNTSQQCSSCNTIVKKSLNVRVHDCSNCGLTINRDVNAAVNILNNVLFQREKLPWDTRKVTPARDE